MLQQLTRKLAAESGKARPGGRAWRQQAMTLAIIQIFTWAARKNRTKIYKTDEQIFSRIDRWSGECLQNAGLSKHTNFFESYKYIEFNKSTARTWEKAFKKMYSISEQLLAHTEMTVILGALLYVAEVGYEEAPQDRKKPWDYLRRAVVALYRRVDNDFEASDQAKAQRYGERLVEAIE